MTKLKHIGKYEILKEIGRGGFGTVYKARDPTLDDQIVAVKELHVPHIRQPNVVQRFLNEARKAVKLKHRGLVHIYAVDEDERGIPYIAMEHLPGGDLADRLHGESLPLDGAIAVVEQVAAALDHAHKRGLVHLDVNPANILFDEEGQAVLVDFGLVKSLDESGMTTMSTSPGTPHYMAPEQAEPTAEAEVDARADVYALGVVAYEMLTGRVPFEAKDPLVVLHAHVHDAPPDPRVLNQALDEGVAAAVLKALEKTPAKRYRSAGAFAHALQQSWKAAREASLEALYAQAQEAVKAKQWGPVVSLCVEMRDLDPDYRDVGTLLTLAASRLAEEEQKRQQERKLGGQYEAALKLLEADKFAEAIESLEQIAEQAPDFRDGDVGEMLDKARVGLKRVQLYEAAVVKLKDEHPDEACADLLAFLKLSPDHAGARARLLEAAEGLLAQLENTRTELEKAQSKLEKAHSQVEAYDGLLLAMEDRDRKQILALAEELAQSKRAGANRLLAHLRAEEKELKITEKPQGDRWISPVDGKEMVRIPAAGEFLYGDWDTPHKLVEFWVDKTPVTNVEYARFVAATGRRPPQHWKGRSPSKKIADHPVVYISWNDAAGYAEWAGKRLPTEEEWEKAARGTEGHKYPWGDWEKGRCNTKEAGIGSTTPVGQYSPDGDSPYGCVDMAGNVWEWTASDHEKSGKVVRGGSWSEDAKAARCAYRLWWWPSGVSIDSRGFRCAVDSEDSE